MLKFLIIALLGGYLSRRFAHRDEDGIVIATLDYQTIWQDMIAFFVMLGFACSWTIALGRGFRDYCDLALLPWLGVTISIPRFDLPHMPDAQVLPNP